LENHKFPKFKIMNTLLIFVIAFIVVLFLIIYAVRGKCKISRIIGGSESFIDVPLTKKVQSAIAKYVDISISPILKDNKNIFKMVFNKCIKTPKNRKIHLGKLREILRNSKLGSANAGRDDKWRINKRAKHINFIAEKLNLKLTGPYLDIGCGDGSITNAISDKVIGTIGAVNIPTCIEYGDEGVGFNQNVDRQTDITKLSPNNFNFITAFMSLHHIGNVGRMISEISRVTNVGGILIIREHNFPFCNNKFTNVEARQYLDWIHIVYDLAEHYTVNELYGPKYRRSNYQPEQYWDDEFDKNDFKKIHSTNYKNRLCSYYAVYIKI
jgi:ubiquinone/menaquinone biosynthesis C-methylase UbiE